MAYEAPPVRDVSWYGTPQSHGALCGMCPCNGSRFVPYEPPKGKLKLVLVGEGPGRRELIQRIPFVGQTGKILDEEIEAAGLSRDEMHVTNSALCLANTDEDNVRAAECCAPRLLRELSELPKDVPIAVMGKAASKTVLGVKGIFLARGFVWTARDLTDAVAGAEAALRKAKKSQKKVDEASLRLKTVSARHLLAGRTVFPMLHPTFAFIHSETWAPIFRIDFDRAARWVKGTLTADMLIDRITRVDSISKLRRTKRSFVVTDNIAQIDQVASILGREVAVDIETERLKPLSPMKARTLTVQISDGVRGIVIAPWEPRVHAAVLTRFLKGRMAIFHNGFCFDSICLERDGVSFDEVQLEDTLSAHHSFASQYPQKLDHVVSTFCLSARTPVVLADGRIEKIAKIVANKLPVRVLTLGPNGIEPKRVIDWHRNNAKDQKWIRIRTTDQKGLASERVAYGRGLVATPEHQIYTASGWRRADEIVPGDMVAVPERRLEPNEIGALIGTLLGDSAIARPRNAHAAKLRAGIAGTHSEASGLAQAKERAMRGFLYTTSATINLKSFSDKPQRRYHVGQSRQVHDLACLVYDKAHEKRITAAALDAMGPVGLAWWYMDDGSKNAANESGVRIATHCFRLADVELAGAWLESTFGGRVSICRVGYTVEGEPKHILCLTKKTATEFCAYIAPYIFPCVRYKLPYQHTWPKYIQQPLATTNEPICVKVISAGPYVPLITPSARARGVQPNNASYCLTVEGNRNFFTPVALVANCDSSPWKIRFGVRGAEEKGQAPVHSDEEDLAEYGAVDAFVTKLAWDAMQKDLEPERSVYEHDKRRATLYKSMQVVGYPVDRRRMRLLSKKLKARASALKGKMRAIVRRPNFAPSKLNDVRHVLFDVLKAPMLNPTPSGLAGTSNATLEALRADEGSRIARFSETLLNWRGTLKSLNTYLTPVPVYADGRAHYNFKPFGVITGRPASRLLSAPRWSKALPERVREIYCSTPGRTLVYFDLAQAEARFAANLSNDINFIAAVAKDIHTNNALILFPDAREALERDPKGKHCPRHSEKGSANAACDCGKPFRDVTKNAGFAILYQAHPSKVLAYLRSQGFPVELAQVEAMYEAMRVKYRDYDQYVKDNVRFVEQNGFLRTALTGRIIWLGFHPKPTDVSNLPIQSGIADVMDTRLLDDIIPNLPKGAPSVLGPRMIIHHYDSATFDTANEEVDELVSLLDSCWKKPVHLKESIVCRKACEFLLPAETKTGRRWSEL